jgi:hypothetical protein
MRGSKISGRKFHPKGGDPKCTDLDFIQTKGPQIFKNMISFFSGPKINPKWGAPKFTDVNFIQTERPQIFKNIIIFFMVQK